MEGEADAPDDAAVELVGAGLLVEEGADVVGGDDSADLDHMGVDVDGDLGEDRSPGLGGVGFARAGSGAVLAVTSMGLPPARRRMSAEAVRFRRAMDLETRRPYLASMSSAGRSWREDWVSLVARSASLWRAWVAASRTAGSDAGGGLRAAGDGGVGEIGVAELDFDLAGRGRGHRARIWAMMVYMPVPMSWVAQPTQAVPSGRTRTVAPAPERPAP